MSITIKSKIIRRISINNRHYFQIKHIVKGSQKKERVFTDSKHFTTRKAALRAIPEINRDLLSSMGKDLF